jgi:hypothetical protein
MKTVGAIMPIKKASTGAQMTSRLVTISISREECLLPTNELADNLCRHHLYLATLDGALFLAPIGPMPKQVLDVGTGTGIWVM